MKILRKLRRTSGLTKHTIILVTGSRDLPEEFMTVVDDALCNFIGEQDAGQFYGAPYLLVVGDCPTGADKYARDIMTKRIASVWLGDADDLQTYVFEADWNKHSKAAGPIRNGEMVQSDADICLAFYYDYDDPKKNRGTKNCVKQAKQRGIEVEEYFL